MHDLRNLEHVQETGARDEGTVVGGSAWAPGPAGKDEVATHARMFSATLASALVNSLTYSTVCLYTLRAEASAASSARANVAELWVQLGHSAEPVLRRPVLVTSLVVSLAGEWTLTCCREEEGRWAPASRSGGWSAPRQW